MKKRSTYINEWERDKGKRNWQKDIRDKRLERGSHCVKGKKK